MLAIPYVRRVAKLAVTLIPKNNSATGRVIDQNKSTIAITAAMIDAMAHLSFVGEGCVILKRNGILTPNKQIGRQHFLMLKWNLVHVQLTLAFPGR